MKNNPFHLPRRGKGRGLIYYTSAKNVHVTKCKDKFKMAETLDTILIG